MNLPPLINKRTGKDRFWTKVSVRDPDECWPWVASKLPAGYGQLGMSRGRPPERAHRMAWQLVNGEIPDGAFVCHRCDNPPCCNPAHLFLGTPEDNIRDAVRKSRVGKLTTDNVLAIRHKRAAGVRLETLATEYNVSTNAISHACVGRTFKEIGGPLTHRSWHKLSPADKEAIRARVASGETMTALAKQYGVSLSMVSRIVKGTR